MEAKESMDTADTSGIDVIEGAAVTGCENAAVGEEPSCGETAVMEPVPADDGAEGEEETGQRAAAPFWGKKRIGIACGIAAALVVGAVGVGALAMVPADAGTAASKAEQKADPAGKLAGTSGTKADVAKGAPNATAGASSGDAAAETGAEGADAAQDAAAAGDGQTAEAAAGTEETATGDPAGAPASGAPEDKAAPSSGSGNSSGSKAASGSSSSGGSTASGSSSGGSSSGSSSKPAASAPKKEEHKHSWEPVYEKKWVPNIVTVKEAYDEPVYDTVCVCKCGETFSTSSEAAAHAEEYAIQGIGGHSGSTKKVQVDTIHHDAVTEDQGQYEKVKTGEKCSGCGQTR